MAICGIDSHGWFHFHRDIGRWCHLEQKNHQWKKNHHNQEGLNFFEKLNKQKSTLLYEVIDSSQIYENLVKKENRSLANVTFSCKK